jgi:hypothetical protein
MWMCDPRILCRKHLLGEHGEIHKFRPSFVKGHSIKGRRGQIEPLAMEERHDQLVAEMLRRGYNHNSPYEQPDLSHYSSEYMFKVPRLPALFELIRRCDECKKRFEFQNE